MYSTVVIPLGGGTQELNNLESCTLCGGSFGVQTNRKEQEIIKTKQIYPQIVVKIKTGRQLLGESKHKQFAGKLRMYRTCHRP